MSGRVRYDDAGFCRWCGNPREDHDMPHCQSLDEPYTATAERDRLEMLNQHQPDNGRDDA